MEAKGFSSLASARHGVEGCTILVFVLRRMFSRARAKCLPLTVQLSREGCTFLRREEERASWPYHGASEIVSSYGRGVRCVIVVNGPGAREERSASSLVKRSSTVVSKPWH